MKAKKLRILFVDDDELDIVGTLKNEGYDVEYWSDVENLEKLSDGRYQIVFLDVRGIGKKYGGNGLDVLKYLSVHNPMVHRIVFSAKPFTASENEITRKHANKVLMKDCTAYDFIDEIENYAKSINQEFINGRVNSLLKLNWLDNVFLMRGKKLSEKRIQKIAKKSGCANDSLKIAANVTSITVMLMKLLSGSP